MVRITSSMEEMMIQGKRKQEVVFSQRESKRRRKVRETIVNSDVLEEIMLRLPVKTLIRFKAVSKQWKSMVTSKSFREKHMLHEKTKETKFLLFYDDGDWYEDNIALKKMRVEWSRTSLVEEEEAAHFSDEQEDTGVLVSPSLDGLVCLYGMGDVKRAIKVINPATRWSYKLPLYGIQTEQCLDKVAYELPRPGFGKDYVTGSYKLVWLHNLYKDMLSCQVFDLSVKQWRQVNPPPHLFDHRVDDAHLPTFANGWLYWITENKTSLIAFDLHREIFRTVQNPITEASSSSLVDMNMGSIDDDRRLLWISETNGDGTQHVWRLTNQNTQGALLKLDKIFSIDFNKIASVDGPHLSSLFTLVAIPKEKNGGNSVMLFRPGAQCHLLCQSSVVSPIFSCPTDSVLLPYYPTLASPSLD